jgi:hypothetical protein
MMFEARKAALELAIALMLAMAASAAKAQWQPVWTTPWEHPAPFHTAQPLRVRVAADGAMFAAVSVTNLGQVTLSRFNADGSFAWLREETGDSLGGIAFMNGGRVALSARSGGAGGLARIRVYDGLTGAPVWQRDVADGQFILGNIFEVEQLAIDASGNLMVAVTDINDYVVVRFDADGNALPEWRHTISSVGDVAAQGIVGLADGGAVVSGQGESLGGGYVTVRFDAQGNAVFADVDLGGIANPLGPSFVALDPNGDIVVASSPEGTHGVPQAQVWKLSPSGARVWTRVLPDPAPTFSSMLAQGLLLAANGDTIVSVSTPGRPFRLVRLDVATGDITQDVVAPIDGSPVSLALAPNGRVLVGGNDFLIQGQAVPGMVEFDAGMAPCRVVAAGDPSGGIKVGAGGAEWSVLRSTASLAGAGADAFMSRYDVDGPCTLNDHVFVNGFDEGVSLQVRSRL